MIIISFCLAGYAVFCLIYACLRPMITQNNVGNVVLAFLWNCWAPLATLLGEIALLVDPTLGEGGLGLKGSSGSKPGTNTSGFVQSNTEFSTTMVQSSHAHYSAAVSKDDDPGYAVSGAAPTLSYGVLDKDSKLRGPFAKPMFETPVDHTGIPLVDSRYYYKNGQQASSPTSPRQQEIHDLTAIYRPGDDIDGSRSSQSHLVPNAHY